MPGTWFLPQNFNFTSKGPLRMGMVIRHWSDPTDVLADIASDSASKTATDTPAAAPADAPANTPTDTPSNAASKIKLPTIEVMVEEGNTYNRSKSRSDSVSLWAKFKDVASASGSADIERKYNVNYGETDHEVHHYIDPIMQDMAIAISGIPAVRDAINDGRFGKRDVYIVTGLRIAKSSFKVTHEISSKFKAEVEGSGPPAGKTPAEAGGKAKHEQEKKVVDAYNTAPDIMFAYQLHIIRKKRAKLFTSESAFMTGPGGKKVEPLVITEATKRQVDEDVEEEVEYESENIGEDEICIYVSPKK